jgi:hypothetical protein
METYAGNWNVALALTADQEIYEATAKAVAVQPVPLISTLLAGIVKSVALAKVLM